MLQMDQVWSSSGVGSMSRFVQTSGGAIALDSLGISHELSDVRRCLILAPSGFFIVAVVKVEKVIEKKDEEG